MYEGPSLSSLTLKPNSLRYWDSSGSEQTITAHNFPATLDSATVFSDTEWEEQGYTSLSLLRDIYPDGFASSNGGSGGIIAAAEQLNIGLTFQNGIWTPNQ